jgi:nucleoid-associated protein YgaU
VQAGDTLTTIAEDFYKDASLADFIAEANSITDATQLSVGAEIIIPPKPE